jgi:hypothetical protein
MGRNRDAAHDSTSCSVGRSSSRYREPRDHARIRRLYAGTYEAHNCADVPTFFSFSHSSPILGKRSERKTKRTGGPSAGNSNLPRGPVSTAPVLRSAVPVALLPQYKLFPTATRGGAVW